MTQKYQALLTFVKLLSLPGKTEDELRKLQNPPPNYDPDLNDGQYYDIIDMGEERGTACIALAARNLLSQYE